MTNKIVHIKQGEQAQVLSKTQKQFNNIIKRLEKEKQELETLKNDIPYFTHKIETELLPAQEKFHLQQAEMVRFLYEKLNTEKFTKTERNKVLDLIDMISEKLLGNPKFEDIYEINKALFPEDFVGEDEAEEEGKAMLSEMLKEMLGIEVNPDEIDLDNPEKSANDFFERLEAQDAEKEAKRASRKKTAKQLEKEARLAEEEKNLSKSVKDVYMSLVKAFHPDREQDEQEKIRKTEIMQEVTAAYEKNDLLTLLQLQLKFEQIDQAHLDNLAEDRLKLFLKILKAQSVALKQEIEGRAMAFKHQYGIAFYQDIERFRFEFALNRDIKNMKKGAKSLTQDIATFKSDPKVFKTFLKEYRIRKPAPELDFFKMLQRMG